MRSIEAEIEPSVFKLLCNSAMNLGLGSEEAQAKSRLGESSFMVVPEHIPKSPL